MTFGAHLLGRQPSPHDSRDFQLAYFLNDDPLVALLASVKASHLTAKPVKTWASAVTARLLAQPVPAPPGPTPDPTPQGDVIWTQGQILDQGNTGHCVGYGWAGGWGDVLPTDDNYANADGDAVYYEAKVIDGEPKQENGSTVRSGAKAMQNRKRLSAYAFAASVDEARTWVKSKGPIVLGTDWDNPMFEPDANGFVKPDGDVAGGHCYAWIGDLASEDAALCKNSWGNGWGLNGLFKVKYSDLQDLFARNGEACAAVELA